MKITLNLIEKSRRELKKDRKEFWKKNKKDFKKNIKNLMKLYPPPKGWYIYVVASNFLFDKEIFPFEYDSWSSTNLIAATKKQGFEVMVFFNKARLGFLSLPALIPLVEHEFVHVQQAAKNSKEYLQSIIQDNLSKKLEIEAEKKVRDISDEYRKQWVLESIVYCYDLKGWLFAKKMADFFHKQMENMYGGGYDKGMNHDEYMCFIKSMKKKDINFFINYFSFRGNK